MASTTSSSSASNSLQSVAARFQERAAQLAREQGLLEQTQKTWNDLKTKEQEQNRQRANLRREFLQARQERDAAEEETLALREKAIILRGEIQEYQQDMEKFQNEMQQEQQDFQSQKEESLMIPHRARRALYLEYLQSRVSAVEQSERNRSDKRAKLEQAIRILQTKRQELEMEKRLVDQQARDKQEEAMQEKAAVQALSTKVRSAIAERKQLRDDLRQAKAQVS